MEDTAAPTSEALELPGFRFHPTEEELLDFYLKNIVFGKKLRFDIIRFINIYHHDPWDLPGLAKMGEREWYFFVPRDRKQGGGGRPNRTTDKGFWKATGSDRKIFSLSDQKKIIGLRKTLVFYTGRAPRGSKTDWVMNEYRLPDSWSPPKDIVLCKIYRKATSLKVLEQMALMEEEGKGATSSPTSSRSSSMETINNPFSREQEHLMEPMPAFQVAPKKEELEVFVDFEEEEARDFELEEEAEQGNVMMNGISPTSSASSPLSLKLPAGMDLVAELQVPKLNMDWTQDQFWNQFNSPWLQNITQLLQQT